MNPQDAFHKTVHSADGGCEALAVRMGMSVQILRNKANPNNEHNVTTLKDVDLVMGLTRDYAVLHALAANHGFVAVRVDEGVGASDLAVLDIVTKVWSGNGDLGQEVMHTLADGRVELHELAKVKDAAHRLFTFVHELMAKLQGMAEPAKGA